MRRLYTSLAVLRSLTAWFIVAVAACIPAAASAQAVTHAYTTDTPLQRGMIVRLNAKDSTKVEALKSADITKMEGVIVAANDAPVSISAADASKQQVFVATTGRYQVLVSNQNGAIKKDDYITISAVDGVGMKAGGEQSRIIGKAIENFDGQTGVSGKTTLKNAAGASIPVSLGLIGIEIGIAHNPLEQKKQSLLPGLEYLQRTAEDIADKPVAPAQVYLALVIMLIAAFIAGAMLYAGIRSALTAIGRNPLAKGSIYRGLVQVVVSSLIVLIIGLTAVYLVIKL